MRTTGKAVALPLSYTRKRGNLVKAPFRSPNRHHANAHELPTWLRRHYQCLAAQAARAGHVATSSRPARRACVSMEKMEQSMPVSRSVHHHWATDAKLMAAV